MAADRPGNRRSTTRRSRPGAACWTCRPGCCRAAGHRARTRPAGAGRRSRARSSRARTARRRRRRGPGGPTYASSVRPSIHSICTIGQAASLTAIASSTQAGLATQSGEAVTGEVPAPSAVYRSRLEASSWMKNRSAGRRPRPSALNTTAALPDAGIGILNTRVQLEHRRRSAGDPEHLRPAAAPRGRSPRVGDRPSPTHHQYARARSGDLDAQQRHVVVLHLAGYGARSASPGGTVIGCCEVVELPARAARRRSGSRGPSTSASASVARNSRSPTCQLPASGPLSAARIRSRADGWVKTAVRIDPEVLGRQLRELRDQRGHRGRGTARCRRGRRPASSAGARPGRGSRSRAASRTTRPRGTSAPRRWCANVAGAFAEPAVLHQRRTTRPSPSGLSAGVPPAGSTPTNDSTSWPTQRIESYASVAPSTTMQRASRPAAGSPAS